MPTKETPPQQPTREASLRAPVPNQTIQEVKNLLEGSKARIAAMLPKHMTPERLFMVIRTALSTNTRLLQCHPYSICGAVVQASMLGLEPNTPMNLCWLVPFYNKKASGGKGGYEVQLILGAAGKVQLLLQSGFVAGVKANKVCEHDDFELIDGLDPVLKHRYHQNQDRGKTIGYWAGLKLKTGFEDIKYASKADIEAHRDRFALARDRNGKIVGPWNDHFDAMAVKTMIHRAAKIAPKSPQMMQAWMMDAQAGKGEPQQFDVSVPPELWQQGALDADRSADDPLDDDAPQGGAMSGAAIPIEDEPQP